MNTNSKRDWEGEVTRHKQHCTGGRPPDWESILILSGMLLYDGGQNFPPVLRLDGHTNALQTTVLVFMQGLLHYN